MRAQHTVHLISTLFLQFYKPLGLYRFFFFFKMLQFRHLTTIRNIKVFVTSHTNEKMNVQITKQLSCCTSNMQDENVSSLDTRSVSDEAYDLFVKGLYTKKQLRLCLQSDALLLDGPVGGKRRHSD